MTAARQSIMNACIASSLTALCLVASTAWAAKPAGVSRGIVFPTVPLAEGSAPHYAALSINPFTNTTPLYVMFDGNVKAGYNRAYLWSPDDAQYGTPVSVACGEERRFPPIARAAKSPDGSDAAAVSWSLRWGQQSSGSHTYHDYVTGKDVTVNRATSSWPVFVFQCSLGIGDAASATRQSFPLDITIPGQLGVSGTPTNLPGGTAPWNHLVYAMTVKHTPGDRKQSGFMQLSGWLRYGNSPCTIRALPAETRVDLMVSPYMEGVVYSNAMVGMQAFSTGAKVDVPAGWYQCWWRMTCPGLRVAADLPGLYPLTQKPPAAPAAGN